MYDHQESMRQLRIRENLHNSYYMEHIVPGHVAIDADGNVYRIGEVRKLRVRRSSIFLKKRIGKKRHKKEQDQNAILKWVYDMRMYLVEANGNDGKIIIGQFKDKMKGTRNMYFKAPLMNHYADVAMGDTL